MKFTGPYAVSCKIFNCLDGNSGLECFGIQKAIYKTSFSLSESVSERKNDSSVCCTSVTFTKLQEAGHEPRLSENGPYFKRTSGFYSLRSDCYLMTGGG